MRDKDLESSLKASGWTFGEGSSTARQETLTQTKRLVKGRPHQVYRTKDGTRVPGTSTIAKIGSDPSNLINWAWKLGMEGVDYKRVRDNAADVGTIGHFMIECFLEGVEPDLSEYPRQDIEAAKVCYNKFLDWWEGEDLAIVAPEMQIVSEKYRYGGTIDCPCRDKSGHLVLLDWKTSKAIWDEHIIQLSGYENLLHEVMQEQVTRRAIIRIGKKESAGDFEVRWLGDMGQYFDVFKAQLVLYNARKFLK